MSNFYLKIILPSIVSILLFILTIFLIIIPRFQENIMEGKREMIKELTNSAWSILSKYEQDEKNGLLNREDAQKTAVSRIEYLRYGEENKDYFWITDLQPKMIMHPYRLDLNGQDLSNFKDPHGKKLFVEVVRTVKTSQNGYVDYMWQWKDDSLHIVPKLSYVKIFKPWGWIVGTGIYIEDVEKEIRALTKKLVFISVGISILVAFLLLFILLQSIKIDKKRLNAEKELNESKEKYRTLVEAATEGLIMLIDGKISYSNNIITSLTGFGNSELINQTFYEIISENNNPEIIDKFSKKSIQEGHYEINLKKKSGGFIEVLIRTSKALFYGESVNIIIIKDITVTKDMDLSCLDYQKLMKTLNVGLFRAVIDYKGRFIFANETTVKILGFDDFGELAETRIIKMIADSEDKVKLRNTLKSKGFIKDKVLKIQKKNGDFVTVSVTLSALDITEHGDLICDGIIEDITDAESKKSQTENLIAELKSNSFLIEQPIKNYISPIYTIDSDATINDAIKAITLKKTDNLLLTKSAKDYIGFITNADIQKRVLALNLHLENPAYLIMSSPVVYVFENTSVFDALNVSDEKKINHLVVKSETGQIIGVLRINDIYRTLKNSLSFLIHNIKNSETIDDLKQEYKKFQLLVKPLIISEVSVKFITNITSSFSDSVTKKIIELSINEIGEPPVCFSFICLGSEGRMEETLFTDQDNAIVYENVPSELEVAVNKYFNSLGEKVCNSLNEVGYLFCKGNIMAKNPQWCQSISVWEQNFANWIATPESQNLLDATIFFDFRIVYGNETLTDRLKLTIDNLVKEYPMFFYHLAYNTFNTKAPQISTGNIISDKLIDNFDLKSAVNLIIMFARIYSLKNNLWLTNTLERLNILKAKQIVNPASIDEIIFAYNFLMKLRFKNQVVLLDNNMPLSNQLNTKKMIDIELQILKKVLSVIPSFQNKLNFDFKLTK